MVTVTQVCIRLMDQILGRMGFPDYIAQLHPPGDFEGGKGATARDDVTYPLHGLRNADSESARLFACFA